MVSVRIQGNQFLIGVSLLCHFVLARVFFVGLSLFLGFFGMENSRYLVVSRVDVCKLRSRYVQKEGNSLRSHAAICRRHLAQVRYFQVLNGSASDDTRDWIFCAANATTILLAMANCLGRWTNIMVLKGLSIHKDHIDICSPANAKCTNSNIFLHDKLEIFTFFDINELTWIPL